MRKSATVLVLEEHGCAVQSKAWINGSLGLWTFSSCGSHVCPDPEGHDTLACQHATVEDTVIQYKELS